MAKIYSEDDIRMGDFALTRTRITIDGELDIYTSDVEALAEIEIHVELKRRDEYPSTLEFSGIRFSSTEGKQLGIRILEAPARGMNQEAMEALAWELVDSGPHIDAYIYGREVLCKPNGKPCSLGDEVIRQSSIARPTFELEI